jgi:hypothetical protein
MGNVNILVLKLGGLIQEESMNPVYFKEMSTNFHEWRDKLFIIKMNRENHLSLSMKGWFTHKEKKEIVSQHRA